MIQHRLVPLSGGPEGEWLLEWNAESLVLRNPVGQKALEADADNGHRLLEPQELYLWNRICIQSGGQWFSFKKNKAAIRDLRQYLETNLVSDEVYRTELRRNAVRVLRRGFLMFAGLGCLYAGSIPLAIWADSNQIGVQIGVGWIKWLGPLIHAGLLLAIALSLRGLARAIFAADMWFRIRRIQRIQQNQ
ncbi:MAG TPA: hypothetical protein VE988_04985 [Gemmataceae bacterium]|nr:hypothetical protein [Gemmataceae bacterium]